MTCSINIILRRKMAGDEILPQETEGKNLPTSSIDRNRSQGEAQEQEPAESRGRKRAGLRTRFDLWTEWFYEAVRGGDLHGVKMYLKTKRELLGTRFTKFEENTLQVAVVSGQEKIFSELMEEDGSNNILKEKNMYGETILTLAAAQGNIKIVERLVGTCDELAAFPMTMDIYPSLWLLYLETRKLFAFCLILLCKFIFSIQAAGMLKKK
ncbi:uncharacterized protein LOC127804277 [Diospyros lotus]|uniref:uncharacterized protein LOC127804277 n=1 Tax=Diospyros lotus TaxID=55363 RepID=UPI002256ED70|nr:uncharacterized protein LOC127804277 [Diospyros lotus]